MSVPRALAKAQSIVNRVTLDTPAIIYRRTQVADTTGGFVDTFESVATVLCSFAAQGITPQEREGTYTVQTITVWRFVFSAGTDVRQTDRIICQGRTFEVTSSASGSIEVAKRVICTEIT